MPLGLLQNTGLHHFPRRVCAHTSLRRRGRVTPEDSSDLSDERRDAPMVGEALRFIENEGHRDVGVVEGALHEVSLRSTETRFVQYLLRTDGMPGPEHDDAVRNTQRLAQRERGDRIRIPVPFPRERPASFFDRTRHVPRGIGILESVAEKNLVSDHESVTIPHMRLTKLVDCAG